MKHYGLLRIANPARRHINPAYLLILLAASLTFCVSAFATVEEDQPETLVSSNRIEGSLPHPDIEATVIVRGQENVLLFPAALEISDNSLVASGKIEVRHADIGLVPFKAFLSTIKVRNKIELQYLIQADREVVQPD